MSLKERLEQGVVVCAEGFLFELERRGYLQAGAFVPEVVLEHPDKVEELHREFHFCGSDVTLAFTYYAHREKLRTIGIEDRLESMNRSALQIAKKVAGETGTLFAGNICNTWMYDLDDPGSHSTVRAMFDEQLQWAKDEGVEFVVAETIGTLGEAMIAVEAINAFELPGVITLSSNSDHKTHDGVPYEEACQRLEQAGALVVGLNCTRGPATMFPLLERIREKVSGFVAAVPVPYRTTTEQPTFQLLKSNGECDFPVNLDPHLINRREIEEFGVKSKKLGVNYIGLCCGASPAHLRTLVEALGRKVPASRYSTDMDKHALLGKSSAVRDFNKKTLMAGWEKRT